MNGVETLGRAGDGEASDRPVTVQVPHDGPGTWTVMVALPVDERALDGAADDLIVAELGRLVRAELVAWRARRVIGWATYGCGYSLDELRADDRRPALVEVRHELMLRLREAGWSTPKIGRLLARDHKTVLHGCAKAADRRALQSGTFDDDGQEVAA